MSELLALFKSNAKFCFQANSQGWFPDSVAVISFCLPSPWEFHLKKFLSCDGLGDSRHIGGLDRKSRGWMMADNGSQVRNMFTIFLQF